MKLLLLLLPMDGADKPFVLVHCLSVGAVGRELGQRHRRRLRCSAVLVAPSLHQLTMTYQSSVNVSRRFLPTLHMVRLYA